MFSIFTTNTHLQKPTIHIGFEDVKISINNKQYIIINTLPILEQQCLIQSTIHAKKEEEVINDLMQKDDDISIIIYGRNATDQTPQTKYDQLKKLGFNNIHIFTGGLFEWLLLQNVYGESEFPTTIICRDLLQYRPLPVI